MTSAAEDAVRNYLIFLRDPNSLRDDKAIADAQTRADQASDPIEKLKALSEAQQLAEIDETTYTEAFTKHAKKYAEENSITLDAFRSMGVSDQMLAQAGLTSQAPASRTTGRTRVNPDAVRSSVPNGQFTLKELQDRSGASTATVRKVVSEMVTAGNVEELGPDPKHSGRGRAPLLFSRK